jgi:hypothetical protein
MPVQPSPSDIPAIPAHVWACLAKELQERAIYLMAQLALNLVADQSSCFVVKESDHAQPSHQSQNPA